MLCLRVKAPFAAFRTFTAGASRPTMPFIPPSAAYGLVLNVAGIESRCDDGQAPMTLTRPGLPRVELALGAIVFPEVQRVYQQLHTYPVGATGKKHAAACKGHKYHVQPVWREFLAGLDAYICLRGNEALEERLRVGLRGGSHSVAGRPRYGVPFFGDNSFMVDILREEPSPGPAYWYQRVSPGAPAPREGRCQLSAWIDRADMTRSLAFLYAPCETPMAVVPEDSWTLLEPPAEGA